MKAFLILAGIFFYSMLWTVVIPVMFSAQNTVYVILAVLLGIASIVFAWRYLVKAFIFLTEWMERNGV